MSEEITASYIFNAEALLPAYAWHHRRRLALRLGLFVLVCGAWLVCFYSGLGSKHKIPVSLYVYSGLAVTLLGFVIWWGIQSLNRLLWKRRIDAMPSCGRRVSWVASDKSFKCLLEGADATLSWDLIHESVQTPNGALVYPQKHVFYWLPKTAFTSEADYPRFLDLLAAKTKHSKLG